MAGCPEKCVFRNSLQISTNINYSFSHFDVSVNNRVRPELAEGEYKDKFGNFIVLCQNEYLHPFRRYRWKKPSNSELEVSIMSMYTVCLKLVG